MPWEITIRRGDGKALGRRDEVVQMVSKAAPALNWTEESALMERIKNQPNHPFRHLIPTWPEDLRQAMLRPTVQASFKGEDFSVQFYGFEGPVIKAIHAEVRGKGNPQGLLASVCRPDGWVVVDDATGREVDLEQEGLEGWKAFQEYRDDAIGRIESSEE